MNHYRPLTIIGLLAAAVVVFAVEQRSEVRFADEYGAIPSVIVPAVRSLMHGDFSLPVFRQLSRLVTALFLHGSGEHLLGNLIVLWVFGYLISENLGPWRTLLIFLVCGVCGNLVQVWWEPQSKIPIIGASGAISGFAGVYLGLAVGWQLAWPNVWPLAHAIPPLQLAAFAVVGFAFDIYSLAQNEGNVAYGAHIGGFLSGLATSAVITTIYKTPEIFHRRQRRK